MPDDVCRTTYRSTGLPGLGRAKYVLVLILYALLVLTTHPWDRYAPGQSLGGKTACPYQVPDRPEVFPAVSNPVITEILIAG